MLDRKNMKTNIKSMSLELTGAIKEYIEMKMNLAEKYLGGIKVINCDFEVGKAVGGQNKGEIFRAEVNLELPKQMLRIEKTEKDLYKAIDKVKDHLEISIKKYKEKLEDSQRGR